MAIPPAGRSTRRTSRKARRGLGHEFEAENEGDQPDAVVTERQRAGVARYEARGRVSRGRFASCLLEHDRSEVDADHSPSEFGEVQRIVAGAAGQVEGDSGGLRQERAHGLVLELIGQATYGGLEPGVVRRGVEGAGARCPHRVAIGVGAGPRMVAATTSPDAKVSTATTWMAAPRPIASAMRPERSAPTA